MCLALVWSSGKNPRKDAGFPEDAIKKQEPFWAFVFSYTDLVPYLLFTLQF